MRDWVIRFNEQGPKGLINKKPSGRPSKLTAEHRRELAQIVEKAPADYVPGLPMQICKFARARRCKLFQTVASFGHCAAKKQTYYGFEGHLIVATNGEIREFSLSAANGGEREAALDMVDDLWGDMLADKGYLGADFTQQMANKGIIMHTPLRDNMRDERSPEIVKLIMDKRRYIETIIGKLVEQFTLVDNKARDIWRLSNKIYRKLLSYMFALQFHGSTRFLES
ncbi:MAG: IS982 family transposase [bacterium]|nr:IS982 family transposase [bacterium]